MQTIAFRDLNLSRLMIGTVQFGLKYGVANVKGQPSYEEVVEILKCAWEGGVNCLDTAAGYGNSEEVLGKAMAELGISDKMIVVTKLPHMGQDFSSEAVLDTFIEESVVAALKRLKLDVIPICLFHIEENFPFMGSLQKVIDKGLVRYMGVSTMTPPATLEIVKSGKAAAVQVPTSALDRRFARIGVFEEAKKRDVAVFVRSVYLQGALVMPEERLPVELDEVVPVRRKLERIAADGGMSLAELAVRYVLAIDGVSCEVIGVESVDQMRENIGLFSRKPLDPSTFEAVRQAVPDLSDNVLIPRNWTMRMPDSKPVSK